MTTYRAHIYPQEDRAIVVIQARDNDEGDWYNFGTWLVPVYYYLGRFEKKLRKAYQQAVEEAERLNAAERSRLDRQENVMRIIESVVAEVDHAKSPGWRER